MNKTIIFDIDGTLADINHRVDRIPNWSHFQTDHHLDIPVPGVTELFQIIYFYKSTLTFNSKLQILCVSGRCESERDATEKWLQEHEIYPDKLILRPNGDYIDDDLLKERILKQLQHDGHDILFVVDDRARVCAMWRKNGITCLQVAEGNY